MAYNLTNMTNGMNPTIIIQGLNQESSGLFGVVMLIVTTLVIMFISYYNGIELKKVFVIGAFTGTIIGMLFWIMSILKFEILFIPIVFLVISLVMNKLVQ